MAQEIAHWNELVVALAPARQVLRNWLRIGYLGRVLRIVPGVADHIVREAESPEPHFSVGEAPGEIHIGVVKVLAFQLTEVLGQARRETELQQLLKDAAERPELTRITEVLAAMKSVHIRLIEEFELVRDKAALQGCASYANEHYTHPVALHREIPIEAVLA